ncbi:MAG TPA: benzoate-CoA ligase family protein [Candidatus Binataceae bacterium]|nr:benzoate-CoA ligase family protein [Candidatus Binataceae bacterium]
MAIGNAASHFIDRHLSEGRASKTAFVDGRGSHTYADLARMVNQAGHALRGCKLRHGDRVILCLNDSICFPALFFGALKIGAIPVPINTLLTPVDYSFMLRDSGAVAAIVSASLMERLETALSSNIDSSRVMIEGGFWPPYRSLEFELANADDQLQAVAAGIDDVAFWLYSSGSTGKPKGVIHRHGDLVATAKLYANPVLRITEHDVIFSASKMFFAYGFGNSCTFTLHSGGTAVLLADRPTPDAILRLLEEYRVTVFFGFPTLYAAILAGLVDQFVPPSHLRLSVSAGEALPAVIQHHWSQRFGVPVLDGIGSTESLHIFMTNRPGELKSGTSGKPVNGYEVVIRDEVGVDAATNQIGDLWVRGPSIATGYWNNPDASRRTFAEGWLRTGDKYFRDGEGYYHYTGRADDMLKVGGVWVSPNEVEGALMEHPAVLEAAVVGAMNSDQLMKPKAFVVLKDASAGSSKLAEELKQLVRSRLAPYKYPHWIEFRAELPKTATGKIRRNLLRES